MNSVRVLVVDDEPITASAHATYLERVGGFVVAGVANDGTSALRMLRDSVDPRTPGGASGVSSIDLVLLDMNLPDIHGIELCRHIRSSGLDVDVIAITAVRDVSVVRAAVSLGIVQYLIKPFTFSVFAEKLRGYLAFRAGFDLVDGVTTQNDVDDSLAQLRSARPAGLEKGLTTETLQLVVARLRAEPVPVSAAELALALELSRVTTRRYLEHLTAEGTVVRSPRYGTPGRPELEYVWKRV
ncbi:response regulator [Subtercola sp. PAMC28395]|nr:response regulator [Subtercola sp. PAMC28395]QWT25461.1 response regulator [Subtercola sp. PAMC28395]